MKFHDSEMNRRSCALLVTQRITRQHQIVDTTLPATVRYNRPLAEPVSREKIIQHLALRMSSVCGTAPLLRVSDTMTFLLRSRHFTQPERNAKTKQNSSHLVT